MYSRAQLADDFRRLGVQPGSVVMLHASVRAVGAVAGGPDVIHLALKDALTPEGTLLMYAGVPRHVDEVGRGTLTAEDEAEIVRKLPPFDAATARADRSHGVLCEMFRSYPGTQVNDHVARFIAWGRLASQLLAPQPWNYAYGRGSTLDRLHDLDGSILLLGCDHDTVTFLHYVEHVTDFPGKRVARFKVPLAVESKTVWRAMEEFNTAGDGVHPNWPERYFALLVDEFLMMTGNSGSRVGNALSHLLSARDLARFAAPRMQQQALLDDPV